MNDINFQSGFMNENDLCQIFYEHKGVSLTVKTQRCKYIYIFAISQTNTDKPIFFFDVECVYKIV